MKMTVTKEITELTLTKLDVSQRQLNEAIKLFFGERDPVSIYTLTSASHQILNDIITHEQLVPDKIMFRKDAIFIKEDCRKEWIKHLTEAKNFFKHADQDLKKGITTILFKPVWNEFLLLDCLQCLNLLKQSSSFTPRKNSFYDFFLEWFFLHNSNLLKDNYRPSWWHDNIRNYPCTMYQLSSPKYFYDTYKHLFQKS